LRLRIAEWTQVLLIANCEDLSVRYGDGVSLRTTNIERQDMCAEQEEIGFRQRDARHDEMKNIGAFNGRPYKTDGRLLRAARF